MKKYLQLSFAISILLIVSCKKDKVEQPEIITPDNYVSMNAFYEANEVPVQEFTINAVSGGSFTTSQGTIVSIPANAFVTQSNQPVTGNVTVQFKDIYKKSDMLLSRMPTMTGFGQLLKSGGEFFIKVKSGTATVDLAPGKKIDINQPVANTGILDTAMLAFVLIPDSLNPPRTEWVMSADDSLFYNTSYYFFNLYNFTSPIDSGSWLNSDNAAFFSAYSQSLLTIHPNDDPAIFHQDVFLVFQNISTVVDLYSNGTDFHYSYAPVGLQCTVVAFGIKDGKVYSSFTPITIGTNMTVNFTLAETTTAAFKTQLEALN